MNTAAVPFAGLAIRVRGGGEVPAGCFGLSWVAGVATKHDPGSRPQIRPEGSLWWVNEGARSLRFAPDETAPEVGLSVDVSPRPKFEHDLANWLASLVDAEEVGDQHLVWSLRHRADEALKQAMRPCQQSEEMARARLEVSDAVRQAMGLQCTALFRVDLAEGAKAPDEEMHHAEPGPLETEPDPVLSEEALAHYAREFDANEAYAERRFFIELPKLAAAINHRRHLPGTPTDEVWPSRCRELSLMCQSLVKSYSSRRPTLPAGGAALPRETVRLMALASRQATSGLDAAWAILASVRADAGLGMVQILRLEDAVEQLRLQLERRFTPWWEIEA